MCARCPVTAECLNWALEMELDTGVFGGFSADERRAHRKPETVHRLAGSGVSELPKRDPQQSDEARLDRTLSWSGRIVPLPQPCTDLDLMPRTLVRLRHWAARASAVSVTASAAIPWR